MRVRLAVVDIGNGETDYEIQTESGYSLDKKELEEVVRRVNMHEWLIMELEEHKKKNPVFYDGGHNEDIYKWQCIAEDLQEKNEELSARNRELTELLQAIRNDLAKYHFITDNTMSKLIDLFEAEVVE